MENSCYCQLNNLVLPVFLALFVEISYIHTQGEKKGVLRTVFLSVFHFCSFLVILLESRYLAFSPLIIHEFKFYFIVPHGLRSLVAFSLP